MFVGKIGAQNPMIHMNRGAQMPFASCAAGPSAQAARARIDQFTRSAFTSEQSTQMTYKPMGNRLQVLHVPEAEQVPPDARLTNAILAPSEKPPMTEKDALMNQYMKQFRIDIRVEGDKLVAHSETGKLILPKMVTEEELEAFRNELVQNGLGDIDWDGVSGDFWGMDMTFSNMENFEMKADYLSSRYAVLKDRIQNEYTGEKREAEMAKLEEIYSHTKEEFANSFAKTVGGFYEDLGQSGVVADMKASVLAMVDSKTAAYEAHLKETGDYANLEGSENQWLRQDDGYMASKLREHMAAAGKSEGKPSEKAEAAPYSKEDLVFAGMFAKKASHQMNHPTWSIYDSDEQLGEFFAEQKTEMEKHFGSAGISNKLSGVIRNSFTSYMDKYMDTLDQSIDRNREWLKKRPYFASTVRTAYIDRDAVYRAFQNALR